jgi:hypothetical protein
MSFRSPTPDSFRRSPERGPLLLLENTLEVAQAALYATHPEIDAGEPPTPCATTLPACLAEAVMVHLVALASSLDRYLAATDPRRKNPDDLIF